MSVVPAGAIEPMIAVVGTIMFGYGLWRDHSESKRLGMERSRQRWFVVRFARWIRRPTTRVSLTGALIAVGWIVLVIALVMSS